MRRERLTLRGLGFEADFYLRQLPPHRRRKAANDPELHYLLIGWRENRSPTRRCDQVFVSARHHCATGNPYLDVASPREPLNDLEALGRGDGPAAGKGGCALIFHHARGGGSTKCLGLYEQQLEREGLAALRLRLVPRSDRLVVVPTTRGLQVHDLVGGLPAFLAAIADLRITRIVVSHVVDFASAHVFDVLDRISRHLACPVDLLLHDYLAVCPRINLVDATEQTCFEPPAIERCRACVRAGGSEIGGVDPGLWRRGFADLAANSDRVIVLSDDMRRRLSPRLPAPLTVWHPESDGCSAATAPMIGEGECLRIAVVGALNVAKGSKVVAALGAAIKARRAPVTIKVFGDSPEHQLLAASDIPLHGRYREEDLDDALSSWAPHVGLVPAIWPETWSFVLTQLLKRGLPVFAFSHGTQAERLVNLGRIEHLMPTALMSDADAMLDLFVRYRHERSR